MASHDSDRLWHRQTPDKGQTTLSDDSEVTLFEIGTLDGGTGYRTASILLNLTLGSHANITIRVKAGVNGSLGTLDSNQYSAGTVTNAFGDLSPDRVTAERIVVTAEGSNATPSTNGTVGRTVEYSRAD